MEYSHQQIREIFLAASEIASEEERKAFLARACQGDPEFESKVAEMLSLRSRAGKFFRPIDNEKTESTETSLSNENSLSELTEGPGTLIGRYRLLEKIGEGGFGVVYMAEQVEPLKRRVALKIIKLGMDTREVIARFEAERQALALMDHPNVARVLDAGATQSGRPFFVMELVKGLPITEFCDRECLTPRERIELFICVCQAAQHAHSKGVIHRDLKPSNILVTMQDGRPMPKVIDFGIAKAVQTPLTERTLFTRFGQMIGTPVYMSPEQTELSAVDVDTRSDVYSLGVVFYELLTSKQPFDLKRLLQVGHYEMLRIIREEEPLRPSTCLTRLGKELDTVAERRHVNARRLGEVIRGDLDWITMKALQKDRSRRYETAAALAEDLLRYLEHRPVRAGPPGFRYRSWKFVQRHRYAVATAVWILLALASGLVFAVAGFISARTERAAAIGAQRTADQQRQLALLEAKRARTKELRARQISYASDMALASHALELGNLGRALSLLERHATANGDDLRGWEWRYLWQQCQSAELFQLAALSNSVLCAAVSRDGRLAAFSALDGKSSVWSLQTRALLWAAHGSSTIALSPDGKILADGTGTLRDGESGIVLRKLPPGETIKRLEFSADGTLLAGLVGSDGLSIWDTQTWTLLARYAGLESAGLHFGAISFSADGKWIAMGGTDGRIRIIEVRTGRLLRSWTAHQEGLTAVIVSPDSRLIASASGYSDDQVRLWTASDGSAAGVLSGNHAWIPGLAFSADGTLLASAGADQSVCIWDVGRKELVGRLVGHLQEVWNVAFLPNTKTLVSGSKDGTVKVWAVPDVSRGQPAPHFSPPDLLVKEAISGGLVFSTDGRELLGVDQHGYIGRWALPSLRRLGTIDSLGSSNYLVTCSPELGSVAAVAWPGTLKVSDSTDGTTLVACNVCSATNTVTWMEFAPIASRLVLVSDYSNVQQWDAKTWKLAGRWTCSLKEGITQPSVSPDGQYLASSGTELVVFALSNGLPVFRALAHKPYTDAVSFSPDGKLLATGSQEGLAKIWEVGTWKHLSTLRGHLLGVHSLAFSMDSRRLATGSLGKEAVKLWDLATMQEVLNLAGPGDLTWRIGFSPDGRTLAALGNVSGVRCWSALAASEAPRMEELD